MMTFRRIALCLTVIALCAKGFGAEPDDVAALRAWIATGKKLRTLSADFKQTRILRTVRIPLTTTGHVWFEQPDRFRWQLGDPPRAIALRRGDTAWLIAPPKKKAKRYAVNAVDPKSLMRSFLVMEFPVANSYEEFIRRFEVLSFKTEGRTGELEVVPRESEARQFIERTKLDFDLDNGDLLVFEIEFRDGSRLRNEFSNIRTNANLDPAIFHYDLDGYAVIDATD